MRFLTKQSFIEALRIILIASILGFGVNFFHSKKVTISASRPPLPFAKDNIPSEDLPVVGITGDKEAEAVQELFIVSTKQLVELLKKHNAILLDARSEKEFQKEHIPGAQNFPLDSLLENRNLLNTLPRDKLLITYCDGPSCDLAESLAYELSYSGFSKIAVYRDGLEGWKKSGNLFNEKEPGAHEN